MNGVLTELARWESFYGIVGSAAGTLIGLQFVIMTLLVGKPQLRAAEAGAAFATPTIVHFSTALFLAALLRAPWQSLLPAASLWGLLGLSGAVYALIVVRRMRKQDVYRPEFEDWLFHAALPLAAYVLLTGAASAALVRTHEALFAVGAAALLLLFVGIHNAWDGIAYHVFVHSQQKATPPASEDRDQIL